jgi:phage host-nuclease inhibitor protein Gam
MSRRKAEFVQIMRTVEEAAACANDYALLSADIAAINAERLLRKAEIDADCDERISHRSGQLKNMFMRLQAWWEAGGSEVAGKLRSADFGGVKIGVRTNPPSLKLPKGQTAKTIVPWLYDKIKSCEWFRTTIVLNKDAMIAHLKDPECAPLATALGFSLVQKDEFFIDTQKATKAPTKAVDVVQTNEAAAAPDALCQGGDAGVGEAS